MSKRLNILQPGEKGIITQLFTEEMSQLLARRLYAVGFRTGC